MEFSPITTKVPSHKKRNSFTARREKSGWFGNLRLRNPEKTSLPFLEKYFCRKFL
jgi:hypothetical protein